MKNIELTDHKLIIRKNPTYKFLSYRTEHFQINNPPRQHCRLFRYFHDENKVTLTLAKYVDN